MPASDDIAQHIAYALQVALGVIFTLSVAPKLRRPAAFVATVRRYEILPGRLARPVSLAVIAIEAFLAVCLQSGVMLEVAVPLAMVSVLGFGTGAAVNLRRGHDIECGCFGSRSCTLHRLLLPRRHHRLLTAR